MSDALTVTEAETGVVRVFRVQLDGADAVAFAADPDATARALGLESIDPEYLDVFPVARLAGLDLTIFLTEGHGIDPESLDADATRLNGLSGYVAILTSEAFGGEGARLKVAPPLELVGAYAEDRASASFTPLPSESARGTLGGATAKTAGSQATRRSGRRLVILLLLAAAFVALAVFGGNP